MSTPSTAKATVDSNTFLSSSSVRSRPLAPVNRVDRERVNLLVHSGYSEFPVNATGKSTLFIGLLVMKKVGLSCVSTGQLST